jgi:hypothetical protein
VRRSTHPSCRDRSVALYVQLSFVSASTSLVSYFSASDLLYWRHDIISNLCVRSKILDILVFWSFSEVHYGRMVTRRVNCHSPRAERFTGRVGGNIGVVSEKEGIPAHYSSARSYVVARSEIFMTHYFM